ncbi:ammonium transporter [Hydrogenivirga sp. 128-5-R1-1]|uniref:ammonium transporter n=1 Tax=Hydrogenivirga sp. 128-5-R1-1 TaxID=392423 RepID=UPI00015F171F|nr:ammonium transporter [Hydrogenivirga sp. 128-5-R1-1]EDP76201.1 ammonium transporter [Hydrogenivirga sp. 128-5-R1-1]
MRRASLWALLPLLTVAVPAFAGEAKLDTGNTAWMLMASALVVFMTVPGLALFYGGLDKSKSILNTIAMSFVAFGIVTITWLAVGYSIAYGDDLGQFMGNPFQYLFGKGITGINADTGYPALLDLMFQLTFATITTALVSGSLVGRMKFSAWIIFCVLWSIVVYPPIAHWVWGGGFLSNHGALDFAGGTVVHINAGIAGLVAALILGKRKEPQLIPNNVPLVALGAGILWFGWFGFNAGSALAADTIAVYAMLNTTVATSAAMLAWMFVEWMSAGKPTVVGISSGIIAGLVAITPAAGFVNPVGAIFVGAIASIFAYFAVAKLKAALGYDDALDVFGIHGVAGIVGAILTGVFADPAVNESAGLLYGNPKQLLIQLEGVIVTLVYSGILTAIIVLVAKALTGLRVKEGDEIEGLDSSQHGESAYNL